MYSTRAILILVTVITMVILTGCQSSAGVRAEARDKTFVVKSANSEQALPSRMKGTWRDGFKTGPIDLKIVSAQDDKFLGEINFHGSYLNCGHYVRAEGLYKADGTLIITNACEDLNLKLDPQKGWFGKTGWGEIFGIR